MMSRKRKAQAELTEDRPTRTKVVTLSINSERLKKFPRPAEGMVDLSQGAFMGLRSRARPGTSTPTSTRATTPNVADEDASSDATPSITNVRPSILKPSTRKSTSKQQPKRVKIKSNPDVVTLSASPSPQSPSLQTDDNMSGEGRPKLKITLSNLNANSSASPQTPQAPNPSRKPSIKFKVKPPPTSSPAPTPSSEKKPKKKAGTTNGGTPLSAAKKRKQPVEEDHESSEDELAQQPKQKQLKRVNLTLSKPTQKPQLASTQAPTTRPIIKIKHKGKVPKRPLGVGYDSELSDREQDPTILDAFILRMQPGPDAEYVQNAINTGTIGAPLKDGGADISFKFLDRHGRRALITIQRRMYAATLVDLPCIVEGHKSWDKKGWIKSADICQMLLVLSRVSEEVEAHNYPLPAEVDQKTWQYAHGLTPPMRWIRKRKFARTNRAQVSDIEAVERKVAQMLADDNAASHVKYELIDSEQLESRNQSAEYSGEEYDSEEDADGEEVEEEGLPESYFGAQNGEAGEMVETPNYAETPTGVADDIDDDDVNELEQMLMDAGSDEEAESTQVTHALPQQNGFLSQNDSSFLVASTSASPSVMAVQTPGTAGGETSDEDEDDEEEDGDEGSDAPTPNSAEDAEKEGTENLQQIREKIEEIEEKIQEQTKQMNKQPNIILRRKMAQKIEALKGDVEQMRNTAGLREDDD